MIHPRDSGGVVGRPHARLRIPNLHFVMNADELIVDVAAA